MQNTGSILAITLRLAISVMLTALTLCAQQMGQGNPELIINGRVARDNHEAAKELNGAGLPKLPEEQPRNICLITGLGDRLIEIAYKDACQTLLVANSCSTFFGGHGVAIKALNDLVQHMQKGALADRHIGMRMSGVYNLVPNNTTGNTYRLFEKATLNLNGPFYSKKSFPSQAWVPNIGPFKPDSREARVTILLHELGHMLRGEDKNWLLPDDSKDVNRSSENTDLIIKRCGNQINMLSQ
jgi:hypothetical protein